jgi:hypothetical protein
MGDGRIFLKILRDTSFNKDLSNEPNFGLIHLAGQYLSIKKLKYYIGSQQPNYLTQPVEFSKNYKRTQMK